MADKEEVERDEAFFLVSDDERGDDMENQTGSSGSDDDEEVADGYRGYASPSVAFSSQQWPRSLRYLSDSFFCFFNLSVWFYDKTEDKDNKQSFLVLCSCSHGLSIA